VTGDERDRLLQLARDATDPNWVAPGVGTSPPSPEYERTATNITNVEPLMIPGLLQTADYARSIMLSAGRPPARLSSGSRTEWGAATS
jgi:hypothetical protein